MLIAEEAVGWSQVVSGFAALAFTWLAKNARSLRRFVFDIWNKLDKASDIIDQAAKKMKAFDEALEEALELVENAKSINDIKSGARELRKMFGFLAETARTLAQETKDGDFKL